MSEKIWSLATTAAAIGGGIMARKVIEKAWALVTDGTVPNNPEDPEVDWAEAIAFALVSGAVVQLARIMVNHKSTQAYAKRKGRLPESATS
ncbi:DUF4235 domain-containing protein [Janibacter alittae]|uniref:DUF4235 domain-containing protein n=1 Tax=Janibacter alittae TaxID=3115209 RepID=A0ABZ2MFV9_9MICO